MENIQAQKANEIKERTKGLKKSIAESEAEAELFKRIIFTLVLLYTYLGFFILYHCHLDSLQKITIKESTDSRGLM